QSQEKYAAEKEYTPFEKNYDELAIQSLGNPGRPVVIGYGKQRPVAAKVLQNDVAMERKGEEVVASAPMAADGIITQQGEMYVSGEKVKKADTEVQAGKADQQQSSVQIRKNFNETAFFFPDLKTDDSGAIEFSFTMPEAVTQWKWMSLAHTKDLSFGYDEKTIVTQKELMVQPNAPR